MTRVKFIIRFILIGTLAILSGCGEGGVSTAGGGAPLPDKILSWQPPSSYTDNSYLDPVSELDAFEIYVNQSGSFTEQDVPMALIGAIDPETNLNITAFNLASLGPYLSRGITYRVALRAVAITGMKSDFSATTSFSF